MKNLTAILVGAAAIAALSLATAWAAGMGGTETWTGASPPPAWCQFPALSLNTSCLSPGTVEFTQ